VLQHVSRTVNGSAETGVERNTLMKEGELRDELALTV
jgi:hypothetical protein